jgi:hypothetical protein
MDETLAGKAMDARLCELAKALSPMDVTLSGMFTAVNWGLLVNAAVPIPITPGGIVTTPAQD